MKQTKQASDCSDSTKNCTGNKANADCKDEKAYDEHNANKPIGDCDCTKCDCPSDGTGKQDGDKQKNNKKYKCKNCGTVHNCGTPPKSCCKCDCTDFKEI